MINKNSKYYKYSLSIAKNFLIFLVLYFSINWWQNKDLLPTNDTLAPVFQLKDTKGNLVTIGGIKDKPTILHFFAPWCQICSLNSGTLNQINSEGTHNVYAVALAWESLENIKKYESEHNLTMPVLIGYKEISEAYKIKGFPTYYFLDLKGKIQSTSFGYTTELGLKLRGML